MTFEEMIEKEAIQYRKRYTGRNTAIKSEAGYRRSSYGSAECVNCSMERIMSAYREYKESMEF